MALNIGFSHTMKVKLLPGFAPRLELETLAPVWARASTNLNIDGAVCLIVTSNGVIPTVLMVLLTLGVP